MLRKIRGKDTFIRLTMTNSDGNISKVINVPKSKPYATDMAIGDKNWAWKLVSKINGPKPAIVVNDVRITGLLEKAISEILIVKG